MIDPIVSLAFAMNSSPGVYAVLLGSGVSSAAGVPTGWELTLDLIRQVAALEGEDCEPDPEAWFVGKYSEEPDYSSLLKRLAPTANERNSLLRRYFEPTEEERGEGKKLPTSAHKSIAGLAAMGAVRVIVTTNFDHLMEHALTEAGVAHTVISTPGQARGAPPLAHGGCFVIKPHGDYLDPRFKNTSEELRTIDKPMRRLLSQVFDEFGLIVCGWSASWDAGLRGTIESSRSLRYTTYWTVRSRLDEYASRIVEARKATVVNIVGADSFFGKLLEMVESLDKFRRPHPLSTKAAVTSLKKYIVDDKYRIQLRELMHDATEELYGELTDGSFPAGQVADTKEELNSRIKRYEALSERLLSLMIAGCYWGGSEHENNWVYALERIANSAKEESGVILWLKLRLYPALLLLYGSGIAALANDNYSTFASLLTKPLLKRSDRTHPIALRVNWPEVFDDRAGKFIEGRDRDYVPGSEHLYEVLREPLREYLPDDSRYDKCFDRFEYLLGLIIYWLDSAEYGFKWGPIGRFGWKWKSRSYTGEYCVLTNLEDEFNKNPDEWPPLRTGLFDGSHETFRKIKTEFDDFVREIVGRWR